MEVARHGSDRAACGVEKGVDPLDHAGFPVGYLAGDKGVHAGDPDPSADAEEAGSHVELPLVGMAGGRRRKDGGAERNSTTTAVRVPAARRPRA